MRKIRHRSVTGILLNESRDSILLIKRRDVPIWVLPGGGVEEGEGPEKALEREMLEETGLQVTISRKVAEYTPINQLANHTHLFECQKVSGSLAVGEETQKIGFFPIDQLPEPFFFIHRDWIHDALKNLPHLIKKELHQVTYLKFFSYFLSHPIQVMRFLLSRWGLPFNSKLK